MLSASHGLQHAEGFDPLAGCFQDTGTVGQVILALDIVGRQLLEGRQQGVAAENVGAQVDFGDRPLLGRGVFFLDDAGELAGRRRGRCGPSRSGSACWPCPAGRPAARRQTRPAALQRRRLHHRRVAGQDQHRAVVLGQLRRGTSSPRGRCRAARSARRTRRPARRPARAAPGRRDSRRRRRSARRRPPARRRSRSGSSAGRTRAPAPWATRTPSACLCRRPG